MIQICFGLHDADGRYSKFVGTTMVSIFENTASPVTINILHDDTLTDDNREKFIQLTEHYNQHVEFHNVDELCPDELNFLREKLLDKINSRFSIGMFYRLLAKKIFGTGKMIYLDADIIVNLDIAELWQQNLQGYPIAAVIELLAISGFMITDKFLLNKGIVQLENYFCSGVILFDLDKFDDNFFRDGVQFLIDNPECESPDQDILNAFFSENYFKLAQKFDAFVSGERNAKVPVEKKIYHYAGWKIGLDLNDGYNRLWFEYFARTPWFNIDIIDRLGEQFCKQHDIDINNGQFMMQISTEHNRAFFLSPGDVPTIKMLFNIQDDEPIIEARGKDSLNELLIKMDELRGQKIWFISHSDWLTMEKVLTYLGFKANEDFMNIELFLTSEQGGKPPHTYSFVRNL
ncbi:MAG: hypothetical protein IJP68_08040 [Selenomonadaceae bacterium]|nr:hypothetical protein [Selenomonadaceae bacterium]